MATGIFRDYMDCERWCFRRSIAVRLMPGLSRRLVATAIELTAIRKGWDAGWLRQKLDEDVVRYCRRFVPVAKQLASIVGHQVIVPQVVPLVVEWLSKRAAADT